MTTEAKCRVQNERQTVLCLVRDLLFYSKIRAAAEAAGVGLKALRDPGRLADEIGCMLVVDLNQPGALDAAALWRERTDRPVVGFVSHVDTETITAARGGGSIRFSPAASSSRSCQAFSVAWPRQNGCDTRTSAPASARARRKF
jgi:hypothetical protein